MKKILFAALITIIVININSCKKGEEDPYFSLLTRKQRLTGKWIFSEGKIDLKFYIADSIIYGNTQIFNGFTIKSTDYMTGEETTTLYTCTLEVNNDNSFVLTTNSYEELYNNTILSISEGTWDFVEKDDNFENKERFVLNYNKSTIITTNDTIIENYTTPNSLIWIIEGLSNLELKINLNNETVDELNNSKAVTKGFLRYIKDI